MTKTIVFTLREWDVKAETWPRMHSIELFIFSLSSDRQHLSYDVCLAVRGETIRTVACCIVH